jgi:hypothetical protein
MIRAQKYLISYGTLVSRTNVHAFFRRRAQNKRLWYVHLNASPPELLTERI